MKKRLIHPEFIRKEYMPLFLLVVACIAVYYPVLGNNFLYSWDDQIMIINDYTSGGWNLSNYCWCDNLLNDLTLK
jgi:hypothetical protein